MIRLAALNDDSSKSSIEDDVHHPKEPSQEVQEENALKLYNEALLEQRNGNWDKAEGMYEQLLTSSLLTQVKPDPEKPKEKQLNEISSIYGKPTVMLKYSCLKNLAVISVKKNKFEEALNYYTQAIDIDGTDVSLWYNTGLTALKLSNINIACEAFLEGLSCSPKHWPSLDKVIICLFALGDYINCLYYIGKAFLLDSNYTRGQVLRDHIINEQNSLLNDIKLHFPKINLYFGEKNEEKEEIKKKLLDEALRASIKYHELCKTQRESELKCREHINLPKDIESASWLDLGEALLSLHNCMTLESTYVSLLSPVNLKSSLQVTEKSDKNVKEKEKETSKPEVPSPEKEKEDETQKTKDVIEDTTEKRNKKNRGSALMEELLWSGKRRSARVRSSLRGTQEPMDVAEALRRLLPRRLLHKTKHNKPEQPPEDKILEEDSMDTMDLYRLFERQESAEEQRQKEELERSEVEHDIDNIVEKEGYFGTSKEIDDVISFIDRNDKNNLPELLRSFVLQVETYWKKTWPNSLPVIYIQCYQLMRKYYPVSFKMCSSEPEFRELLSEAGSILLYGELCLDHNNSALNKSLKDPKLETKLPIIFMQNIVELIDRHHLFESEDHYFEFLVRLYWLRCHMFLNQGQTNLAIAALNDVLASFDRYPKFESTTLTLRNIRKNNVIGKAIAEEFLAYQSRRKGLAEVVRLYEDEAYQELTEILKETFSKTGESSSHLKDQDCELVDRRTQLSMLINGLYHLNEYKEAIYWLEVCCYEVLHKSYVIRGDDQQSWMVAFDRFLASIEECLTLGETSIKESLPPNRVSRFTQTLCHAICRQLDDSDRPPCPARPWIMLNKILVSMEAEGKADKHPEDEEEDENDIPSSILVLFTAHEYLGRREWCNCNESVLLFLIMDQVIPHIRNIEWASFRETVQQHLEQVIYCLYSHPNKKSKARYLTDHNVTPIPLTWSRGIQLFDLFRPDETPAYDSLRVNLIGSDTEVLFRRIAALIPDEMDPVQNSEKMMDFIVGKINEVPLANVRLPEAVQDLFYILGDYYFKTHECAKAVNYLLMDLCANPDRVDSWASMALSRASILEQQLNSCDPIKDEVFLQDALSALRCYEHCLQLENKQCSLWIEYGTFVYTVHSFCSQRMKLESDSLSLEQFEELETTKNKMLDTAKQAFINANLIWYEIKEETERQDERWLHHYMLGKICEKHGDLNYLEHYEKAAELLYENEAEFPSKVGYTTPQTLAIEALEVYYRVHACVLKNMELNEGKPLDLKTKTLFLKYLTLCSNGPFVKQISKGDLQKIKAKEQEAAAQAEKEAKTIKDLLDEILSKVEEQLENEKLMEAEAEIMEVYEVVDNEQKELEPCNTEDEGIGEELKGDVTEEKDDDNKKSESEVEIIVIDEKPSEDPIKLLEISEVKSIVYEDVEPVEVVAPPDFLPDAGLMYNDYQQYHQYEEDNYYVTLDDLKNMPPPTLTTKKKRRVSQASISSSSAESEEIKYDDESSSSSTSSESSESSQSTSSSTTTTSASDVGKAEKKKLEEAENAKKSKVPEDKIEEKPEEKVMEKVEAVSANNEGPNIEPKGEENPVNNINDSSSSSSNNNKNNSNNNININNNNNNNGDGDSEGEMLKKCLTALETCALRFPQHYKSVYRLAHFYFRSKEHRNIEKCRDLLLGKYHTSSGNITGLFSERKNTNFFNGIWRIPASDVDRPGSFASHMSRSVLLLMEVLRDLKDHKMLLELCLQLRKVPEPDKKYLREDERNQLSVQAFNLSVQTLRKSVKESLVMTLPIVLDCYRCYQKVQKHYTHKEAIFGDILLDGFKRLGKGDKCTLDQAIRFCQSEISTTKVRMPKVLTITQMNASPGSSSFKTKLTKAKKTEKKKATPKPQVTAKPVMKTPKPKKAYESKKKQAIDKLLASSLVNNALIWSSSPKSASTEKAIAEHQAKLTSLPKSYADLLKSSVMSTKSKEPSDKKLTLAEQVARNTNLLGQFNIELNQNLMLEQMKMMSDPRLYSQYNPFALEYNSDFFKQYSAVYNNAMMSGFLPSLGLKKPRTKYSKPRPLGKPKPLQKDVLKPEEKKPRASFNPEEKKLKPNITFEEKKMKPSVTIEEKKLKPSVIIEEKKLKPSVIIEEKKLKPSVSIEEKRLKPSVSIEEKKLKPSVSFDEKKLKPSVTIEERKAKPILTIEEKKLKPSVTIEERKTKPSVIIEEKSTKATFSNDEKKSKPVSSIEEKKPKTNFNIDDILGKPSKIAKQHSPKVLTPSQINLSIENKIKVAFTDVFISQDQVEAMNLSPNRKKLTDNIKRTHPEVITEVISAKKICRGITGPTAPPPSQSKDDIEIVVIDD